MDEPIVCITNQLPDFHGCVIRDTHLLSALGDNEPDPVRRATIREEHLADCGGCVPRPASTGFLCRPCATRTDTAVHAYPHFKQALEGIDRAKQNEVSARSKPGSLIPIPPIPLAIEELESYEASFTGSVDVWASTARQVEDRKYGTLRWVGGAVDAVRFLRAFANAERAHPVEEATHKAQITRCPRCGHRTLAWHPPTRFLGDVIVQCEYADPTGRACGYTVDQEKYEELAAIEDGTRPTTPANDRALVFARRRTDADRWAELRDLRPSDWLYIGSAKALNGLNTGHRDRYFLDGFDDRRDAQLIRGALDIADLTRQDQAA